MVLYHLPTINFTHCVSFLQAKSISDHYIHKTISASIRLCGWLRIIKILSHLRRSPRQKHFNCVWIHNHYDRPEGFILDYYVTVESDRRRHIKPSLFLQRMLVTTVYTWLCRVGETSLKEWQASRWAGFVRRIHSL